MKTFKFDEEPIKPRSKPVHQGKMVSFLVKRGIAENATQANFLLMGCIILCLSGIAFMYYKNIADVNQVSPASEEIELLEEYEDHTRN